MFFLYIFSTPFRNKFGNVYKVSLVTIMSGDHLCVDNIFDNADFQEKLRLEKVMHVLTVNSRIRRTS